MPRKPAILLLLLVLLLSIGGAVFHHHLNQNKRPAFPDLDSYLRDGIASNDWMFLSKSPTQSVHMVKPAWWNKFGIRPKSHYQRDDYHYKNTLTEGSTLISIWREDGKVVKIHYIGGDVVSEGFKKILCNRFPALRDPSFDP